MKHKITIMGRSFNSTLSLFVPFALNTCRVKKDTSSRYYAHHTSTLMTMGFRVCERVVIHEIK